MKTISTKLLLFVILQNVSLTKIRFRNFEHRFFGSVAAAEGQFPFQIALMKKVNSTYGFPHCGGSILRPKWVLTAAHCVVGTVASGYLVLAGTNIINAPTADFYEVTKLTWHERFNTSYEVSHDIALVKTDGHIVFRPNLVQPLRLADREYASGTKLQVSGWGRVTLTDTTNFLHYLTVKLEKTLTCKLNYAKDDIFISLLDHVCTNDGPGKGTCWGDSGGPLVYNGVHGPVQVGIVSFGISCALGYSDVYTKVFSFRPWILSTILKN